MKTILLTGATGFVGSHFLEKYQKKYQIFAAYRHQPGPSHPHVTWVSLDLTSSSDFKKFIQKYSPGQIDYIVHIGGSSPNRAYADGNFNATILGTRYLLALGRRLCIRKFIFISSISVKVSFNGPYKLSKLKAEKMVKNSGLKYTILRPTNIIGPNARDFSRIVNFYRRSPILFLISRTPVWLQPLFVFDLVKIIENCLHNRKTDSKTIPLYGRESLPQKEFLQKISGKKPIFILALPAPISLCISRVMGKIYPKLGINEERFWLQTQSLQQDPTVIEELFGIKLSSLKKSLTFLKSTSG